MASALTNLEIAFSVVAAGGSAEDYDRHVALLRLNRCWYCGGVLNEHAPPDHLTRPIDNHLTPLSRGGHETPLNTVRACLRCSRRKGNLTLAEFRARFGKKHRFWGERYGRQR